MAHYAFLDENNVVTEVIMGIDETELIEDLDPESWYGNFRSQVCKRTSYNTYIDINGASRHRLGGVVYRKQYAGIGYTYDADADVFIAPKPFTSWVLDANYNWQAPIDYPADGKNYSWDESNQVWVEFLAS